MAYKISLTGQNKVIAERMLERIAKILNECNIDYWLEGGTLLGIYREQRLLPWDNDIDISLMIDQKDKLHMLFSSLKEKGFRVRKRFFNHSKPPFKKGHLRMIKIRESRFFGLIKGNVCLELFIKYPVKDRAFWEIDSKIKSVPYNFYKQLKIISFKGFDYKIPLKTEAYLTYRYGNWETPVKEWNTGKDDRALN